MVAAALGILEADGEEPSLRAVARAAGVSAMAPYRHFPNKVALMAAVANHGFEALHGVLVLADDKPDPREALVAQGLAFVEFATKHPPLFRLMYSHRYGSAGTDAVMGTYRVLADRVADILPTQVSAGALACRALAQGIATILLNDRLAPSTADDIATALRLFAYGAEHAVP